MDIFKRWDGLKYEKLWGFTKKSNFYWEVNEKPMYRGGIAKKGWAWTVCRFKELLDEKEEMVFLKGG